MAEKEITLEIKRPEIIVLLVFLTIIFVMELQVTFGTPISFGDEGFHTRMAQWIAQNVEYPVWVPFTESPAGKESFARPPFWNLLEAGFSLILGFSEAIVKFLTPFIAMFTGIAAYLFGKRFYNGRVGFIAAAILVTVPSFVTYAVLFYTDVLVTFFILMFMFMFALSANTGRRLHMMVAGSFGAFALMTKITGGVAYIFVVLALLYYLVKEKKLFSLIKRYSPMLFMMILIPSALVIRTYVYHGTPSCYTIPYIGDAIPSVGSVLNKVLNLSGCSVSNYKPQYKYEGRTEEVGSEADVLRMGIVNYLEFAYGNIWFVVFALFASLFLFFNKMERVDKILFLMLLLYIPIFLISTWRAEDTARYALTLVPVISIISAKCFDELYNIKPVFLLLLTMSVLLIINFWIFAYYFPIPDIIIRGTIGAGVFLSTMYFLFKKNYKNALTILLISFILSMSFSNGFNKATTMAQVKVFSPLFFEACDWVKTNTLENSLLSTVWTYRTAYNCQRSVVGSYADMALSNNVTHILSEAKTLGVTHIFIQKFSLSNQALSEKYPISYVQLLEGNSTHFKKVFENGPSLNQCLQQGGCDGNIVYEIVY